MIILSHDSQKPIHHIFHISDIHIRLYQRKLEYLHVFEKLFQYLSSPTHGKNNIIVVTGDIVHSKNELSPECDTMTFDFLSTLASIFPTLIIAGNHDALLNNRNRMDTLSSILHQRNTKNLYFLKQTDIYQFQNLYFYVDSLLDEKKIDMTKKYNSSGIHIALFHGSIPGWKNAKGYVSDSGEKYMEEFTAMDYVLLGDIHLFQYMSDKKPVAAYASSLISQNFGETDPNHGILIWNLLQKSQTFQPIQNPYRHQDLYLLQNEIVSTDNVQSSLESAEIAKWGQIRVHALEDEIYSKRLFSHLQKIHPEANFHFQRNNKKNTLSTTNTNHMSDDLTSLKEFITENVPSYQRDEVYKYFLERWHEHEMFPIQWEILTITFSNLFGYGNSNHIDFSSSKNIIGIFGNNSAGKSTIVDIISLLLFDKVTRLSHGLSIPKEVIHVDETNANGEILLKIGSETYLIQKEYKRQKNEKIKQTPKFFKISSTKKKTELTGEQRKKTNQFIEHIIGKYDTFIYINSYLQQREQSFREMTPTVKKKFMNDLYGYHWFTILEKQIKEEIKQLEIEYRVKDDFNKTLLTQTVQKSSSLLDNIKILHEKIQLQRTEITHFQKQKDEKLLMITWTKKKYNDTSHQLSEQIKNIENHKKNLQQSISNANSFLSIWENDLIVQNYTLVSESPFFQKWHPNSQNDWTTFYQNLQKNSTSNLSEISSTLHQKLKEYSDIHIEVDPSILSWYSPNDHPHIKKFVENEESNEEKNEILLKNLYASLHFPIDTTLESLSNEKQHFFSQIKNLQKTIHSQLQQLKQFQTIQPFLDNENIPDFLASHKNWKTNSIYQKFSPFFQTSKNLWKNESQLFHHYTTINNITLQNEIQQIENEMEHLHSKKSILPPGIRLPPSELLSLQKISSTKLSPITNIFKNWNEKDETNLLQLQKNETTISLLETEIELSESTIATVTFIPNPKCNVCLQNRDYLEKISKQEQILKKKTQIKKILAKNQIIINYFTTTFSLDKDSSSKNILFQKQKNINLFHDFEQKQKNIDEALITLQKHQDYQTQQKLSTQISLLKTNLQEKKETFSKSFHYLQHAQLYQYLHLQWNYFSILPSSFDALSQRIETRSTINESNIDKLQNDLIQLENESTSFQETLKKDIELRKKIFNLEDQTKKLKKCKKWLSQMENSIQKKNQAKQLQKINELQNTEKNLVMLQQNSEIITYLKELWQRPSLWKADILDIQQQIEIHKKNLLVWQNDLQTQDNEFHNLNKQLVQMKKQWELDQSIYSTIEAIELSCQSHFEQITRIEEELLSEKLKYQTLHENECLQKENEKKLYDLKKDIDNKKLLHSLLDKDGIPLYLLGKKMILLESQMNELLTPFLPEKKIRFFIEDKQIQFGLVTNSNPTTMVNLFGGMESFILELVIKLTFSKYSILPRSNFFIIDEGISVLDQQNISNIDCLFRFLSQLVTNVLLISHLPQIQDFVDQSMYITKSNNKSHVIFGNTKMKR